MDRDEALKLLTGSEKGVEEWNRRRREGVVIPLDGANLSRAHLSGVDFTGANLTGAKL